MVDQFDEKKDLPVRLWNHSITLVQQYILKEKLILTFLDGARKVAKEPLAKFNARDESRSLMLV